MTKAPTKPDSRAKALAGMTKPELVKTIKTLDSRVTKLLNRIVKLEEAANIQRLIETTSIPFERGPLFKDGLRNDAPHRMPWEQE